MAIGASWRPRAGRAPAIGLALWALRAAPAAFARADVALECISPASADAPPADLATLAADQKTVEAAEACSPRSSQVGTS
jgi:hypothetical protein